MKAIILLSFALLLCGCDEMATDRSQFQRGDIVTTKLDGRRGMVTSTFGQTLIVRFASTNIFNTTPYVEVSMNTYEFNAEAEKGSK